MAKRAEPGRVRVESNWDRFATHAGEAMPPFRWPSYGSKGTRENYHDGKECGATTASRHRPRAPRPYRSAIDAFDAPDAPKAAFVRRLQSWRLPRRALSRTEIRTINELVTR